MSINLHLWKSEEKNIKLETLKKITLNGSHSAKWLEKLKVDFSNGSITEKDIKRIDKHLDNKESRTEVLKLLNNLVSIYKEATDKKICNKVDYTKFLKIIPDHLKNCKIDEIIKNISDPELFNKIIQQKYEKNGDELDLDSLNKILKHMNEIKDKKTTYVWNSDLQEKILNIEPADKFSEIAYLLHHNNLIKKQNLDEIVKKKVKTVNDINDKLLIIHKYPESKKLMPIFIQDFASKEIKDWKKFASETPDEAKYPECWQSVSLEQFDPDFLSHSGFTRTKDEQRVATFLNPPAAIIGVLDPHSPMPDDQRSYLRELGIKTVS